MDYQKKDKVIPVPDYTLPPLPLIEKTGPVRGHNGVTFVAGEGIKPTDIMFIASCVSPQEASKFIKGRDGGEGIRVQPRYLRSDSGIMFTDIFNQEGIDLYKCYYTALVKWLLPKNERAKIPKEIVNWVLPSLEAEIQAVNPKIIVCIGKPIFDLLSNIKLSLSDAKSGWFYNEKYNAKIYLIEDTYKLVSNPEYIGKFRVEAREIRRMHDEICNVSTNRVVLEYETITNSTDLRRIVSTWKKYNYNVVSVDCEWAGNNHIDGKLRSTQFCWAPGKACYVRWMDDKGKYAFDIGYKEAGKILAEWLDQDDVKYIGHHFAADAPWLHHVLGLKWYEKCIFDTEFAQQTANEAEDLSLERIAMKYTDLGRYDLDLVLWVKQNKALMEDGGYGAIPDEILIPYACKDVDTVFRAWPFIQRSLQVQDLLDYYNNIFHPFVTDVFVSFALVGLPMDVDTMDELRVLYTFARDKMEAILQEEIHVEAKNFILIAFATRLPAEVATESYLEFISLIANSEHAQAWNVLKNAAKKPDDVPKLKHIFDHFIDSAHFNIRSPAHLKRWLFNVKCYEPIKSTGNKEKGLPATSWEKIKSMPPEAQKNYNPAVDKQTLQILSEKNNDRILRKLLQLNAVGNICKAFLKEADVDADGNVVKENGLHFYLCSDNRVHGQMSTTETGRPRCVHGDTLIRCYTGFKRIRDIKVGDLVWTHLNRWRRVEATYIKPVAPMYEVSFDNGEILKCTEEHLLLTEEGEWISVRDVCLQKAFRRSGTSEESCLSLPGVIAYRRTSRCASEYNTAHNVQDSSPRIGRRGIQEIESSKIFQFQIRRKKSLERKDRRKIIELEGGLRRWLRLFDTSCGWTSLLRSSYCDSRSAGSTSITATRKFSCASYRSGSEKQCAGQSSVVYENRPSRYSREIQTNRAGVKIKRIIPCGSHPVYDISVKEDHSYEAAGCFSHNSWKPNSLNWPSYVNTMISNGISDLFGKLKERGELPEKFEKFIVKDDKGEYKSKVPSIRSCVKAPEGWCFVESDYQTAEIRGLAFISGDKSLIDIVCNPDLNFAVTKDDKKVRLSFPSEVFPPSVQEEYKHLLYSPDDPNLIRKDDGSLKHPKQDLHWSLAEMVHIKPREVLDDKKDRGAAKVGNFSCISKTSYVQTLFGPKIVTNIALDDLLWDGVEWVSHEGIQYQGDRYTINYQGLSATPDHVVWLADGNKCCFGDAAINGWKIKAEQTVPLRRSTSQNVKSPLSCDDATVLQRHACFIRDIQRSRNKSIIYFLRRFCTVGVRQMAEYRLQRFGLRPYRQRRSLLERQFTSCNATSESEKYTCFKMVISDSSRSHGNRLPRLTCSDENYLEYAANGLNREGNIREGKEWRTKKSAGDIIKCKSFTSQKLNKVESKFEYRRETNSKTIQARVNRPGNNFACGGKQTTNRKDKGCTAEAGNCTTESISFKTRLCRQYYKKANKEWPIGRPIGSSVESRFFEERVLTGEEREAWLEHQRSFYSQVDTEGPNGRATRRLFEEKGFKLTKEPVYDIINVGPRHRFVANGLLISNSAYGASASTLERKIEQDTGKKPDEGTGQRLLKALEKRQPVAQDFLIKMERVPEKPGYYRAASGRIRHFSSHDPKYLDDIDEHLTMGLFKSMGREARNFPMQESVAATAARAGKWLLDTYIKLKMQARPLIILYDSVVTLCPLEERFRVAQLHQLFMTDANTWDYHGRKFSYPIDTDYVYRWSAKPDKNDKKLLEDKTYKSN